MSFFGPRAKVCTWHAGRCGSTVLGDLLNQDTRILWRGEVLERYSMSVEREEVDASLSRVRRLIRNAERQGRRRVLGLEMKYWHLPRLGIDTEWMVRYLDRRGYRHVILERQNLLRVYVSSMAMQRAGPAHLRVGKKQKPVMIGIDPDTAVERMRWFAGFYSDLKQLLPEALLLTYREDLLPDPRIGYQRVVAWLGMESESVEVRYQRTNPGSLEDKVLNWDEVAARLRDTEFAWMLDD